MMNRLFVVMCVALLMVTAQPGAQQRNQALEKLFASAEHKATVTGDLRGAIEDYKRVVATAGKDRAAAARALMRMAEAYQKLGDAEAQKVYQRIVTQFSDQKDTFALAQQRLARRADTSLTHTGLSLRRVYAGEYINTVSPDERWAVLNDFNIAANGVTGADLVLLDLRSGTRRVLDKHPGTGAYVEGDAVFSPDGSQVAYHVAAVDGAGDHEIRIVSIDGGAAPRVLYQSKESSAGYVDVKGWTPDGRRLLISPQLKDGTWQLSMLSIADRTVQPIKSFSWAQVHAALSPDGRYIAYAATTRDSDVTRDLFILAVDGSREVPLVQHPAHDSDPVWSVDGAHVLFRSNRTRPSSLWAIPVKDGRPVGEAVLVKDNVPSGRPLGPQLPVTVTRSGALYYNAGSEGRLGVYHVTLGADGKAAGPPRVVTNHEGNTDCCAAVSPDGKRLAYYSRSPRVLVIRELSTGSEQEIRLNLEINFLVLTGPQWFPDGQSLMVHGSIPQQRGNRQYRIDLRTGGAELLPTTGISVHSRMAPDGKGILASNNGLRWHDLTSGSVTQIVPRESDIGLVSPTVSPDGKRIAYWRFREGKEPVSEIVVASRTGTGARVVCRCDFPGTYRPLNVLTWMPDQRHLVFSDAEGTLWRIPVDGGPRERLGVSMPPRIQGPHVQPDGRGLYFSVEDESAPAELWALENFLPASAK